MKQCSGAKLCGGACNRGALCNVGETQTNDDFFLAKVFITK